MLTAYLILLLSLAALWDWRTGRIPFELCIAGLVIGFGCGESVGGSFLGLCAAFWVLLPWSVRFHLAPGDQKLLAATGAIVGPLQFVLIYCIALMWMLIAPSRIVRPFAPIWLLAALPVIAWRLL